MWRFTRNNGITEGFHNKMELINRQSNGFRNFENLQTSRQGTMWVISLVSGGCPCCWRRAPWIDPQMAGSRPGRFPPCEPGVTHCPPR